MSKTMSSKNKVIFNEIKNNRENNDVCKKNIRKSNEIYNN